MAIALKSNADQYGTVTVLIHWMSAVLILVLIVSGFRAAGTVDLAAKTAILRVHVPIAVLALTVVRIVWWWGVDRKPGPVSGSPRWQQRTAQLVHMLLYLSFWGRQRAASG